MTIFFITENKTGIHSVHLTRDQAEAELDNIYYDALEDESYQVQNQDKDTVVVTSTDQQKTFQIIPKEITLYPTTPMDNEYINSIHNHMNK